jgi:hypothetical protein
VPVDRTLAEDLTRTLVELYADLERQIVVDIARRLKTGITGPDWAGQKLASINDLRNAIQHLIRRLDADTTGAVEQTIALAFARGGTAGLDELAKAGYLTATQVDAIRTSLPGAEAINRLAYSLASTLRGTHLRILRWSLDAYRDVIATSALPQVLSGTTTRLAASQHAWDRLVAQGITGFVDKAGRRWQLTSYVEMATRTGVAQAAVEGHLDRLADLGVDLVIVSDAPQECHLCRPWEGKVLSRGDASKGIVHVQHATQDDITVSFHLAGTVAEAIAAGLMHPNCRHSLSAYLPGVTKIPTNTQDPEGDKARQEQRALERGIRKAKTQAAAALSPADAQRHEAKVRDLQADLREHLKQHPELRRLRYREQIGAGNIPPNPTRPGPKPPPPKPPPAPATGPVKPPQPPKPSASDRIAQLVTQQPADVRKLSGGETAHTDLVTYANGDKLVHKVNGSSSAEARKLTDAEQLGAAVVEAVGLRAPAVHRSGPGEVYMEYIDGKVGAELVTHEFEPAPQHVLDSDDGRLMGLADVLMNNMDRNIGNWILDPSGRLVGIDHGVAFERDVTRSPFAQYLMDETDSGKRKITARNDFTPADMALLRGRLDALRPQFEQVKRLPWWNKMMTRLAALERAAHGTKDRIR